MTTEANSDVINNFIIDMTLISPISDIIIKLKNNEFRDVDVKWLDKKLESFTRVACETLGMPLSKQPEKDTLGIMNNYIKNQFTERFNILLNYFKSYSS